MILKSCYIESFGSIRKQTISFDKNLTSFCKGNGSGKTTLAAFLEAMFYGMESDRTNSKEFVVRKHFNPFEGGNYGGNVVFTSDGATYKIERYFDAKSDTKDSLVVYKNGSLFSEFREGNNQKVGDYFFGIDKQSFERTIFINAAEIEIGSTSSINSKLNNFIEGTDGIDSERAVERIKNAANYYKKSRGYSGRIDQEEEKRKQLGNDIRNREKIKEGLPAKYDKLEEYDRDKKNLQNKQKVIQDTQLLLKDWNNYDNFLNSANENQEKISCIEKKYPKGIPSAEELTALRNSIVARDALLNQTECFLSKADTEILSELESKFSRGIPTEADVEEINNKIREFKNLSDKITSEENFVLPEREKALKSKFASGAPDKKMLEDIQSAFDSYDVAEKEYAQTPDYVIEQPSSSIETKKSNSKKYLIAAIVFTVLAAVGVGIIFVNMIAGIILIVSGILCLFVTAFFYLNNKTSATVVTAEPIQRNNPEKLQKERQKNDATLKIQQLLSSFNYPQDRNISYLRDSFFEDIEEYKRLIEQERDRNQKIADMRGNYFALQQELAEFFNSYGLRTDAFSKMISELCKDINKYNSLTDTKKKLSEQYKDNINSISEKEREIETFCEKYNFNFDEITIKISDIERDLTEYDQAKRSYNDYSKRAEGIKTDKRLEIRPSQPDEDETESINDSIDELNHRCATLKKEIDDDEFEAEKLDDDYSEVERCTEALENYTHIYNNLTKTADLIQKAERRLKDKYILPIRNNFTKYASVIEETLGEKIIITPNFEIRYECNGIERSEKHLSAGQLSICAFCFRMALIENMYTDDKPFLILDDPFVNLDEKHFDKVRAILKTLSNNLQVIYFTCHESREI